MKESFSHYFKKYRLKSEFETLTDFANALSDQGYTYDISIFSHWQKGTRIPRDRILLLTILQLFVSHGGITTINEINIFLEAAGQGYLTKKEESYFHINIPSVPFTVPSAVPHFTGREKEIKNILQALKNNKNVLISGSSGTGKTSLAITIAHMLRHVYQDGILWIKVDNTNNMRILANIAFSYGENILYIRDVDSRSAFVRNLLAKKHVLFIIDNARSAEDINFLPSLSSTISYIITSNRNNLIETTNIHAVELTSFDQDDTIQLLITILGSKFFIQHQKELIDLANSFGNLPLTTTLLAKKIQLLKQLNFHDIKKAIESNLLKGLSSHDQSLESVFEFSFQSLTKTEKNVFISLSIFQGPDFSIEIASAIHKLSQMEITEIMESLVDKSFLQRSIQGRYTLHPALKLFALSKKPKDEYYHDALVFFLQRLKKHHREKLSKLSDIEQDIENIIGLFISSFQYKAYNLTIELWEYLTIILWDLGMWNDLIRLSQYTIKASDLEKDEIVKAKCYLRDLSLLYFQRNENTKAKEIIAKGLNIARRISNNNLLAYGYLRSGMILLQEKKYRKSLSYLEKSLELFSTLKEGARVGECLCYLSNCYLKLQKHKLAKQTGEEAFKICTINNHKRCQADALSYLAEIYISEKDYNNAKRLLLQSIKIDNQIMRKGQIWIYNTAALSFIEHMIGSSKKAKIYYEDFQQNNKVVNLSWRVEDLLNYYTDTQSRKKT